jgi:hypothetical protein
MGRRNFTAEFKHEALVLERGMTISQAAKDLGLHGERAAQVGEGCAGERTCSVSRSWQATTG